MKLRTVVSRIAVITLAFPLVIADSHANGVLPESRRLEVGSKIMINFGVNERVWVAPPREAKVLNIMDTDFRRAHEQAGQLSRSCNPSKASNQPPGKRRIPGPGFSTIDPASALGRARTFQINKYEDIRMQAGGVQTWIAVTQVEGRCHGWIRGSVIQAAPGQNNYIIVR
jgi:hypothetical protein